MYSMLVRRLHEERLWGWFDFVRGLKYSTDLKLSFDLWHVSPFGG